MSSVIAIIVTIAIIAITPVIANIPIIAIIATVAIIPMIPMIAIIAIIPILPIIAIIPIMPIIASIAIIPIIPIIANSPDKPFRSRHSSKTAPEMLRLHRWGLGLGAGGWGLGLVIGKEPGDIFHTLRLRPGTGARATANGPQPIIMILLL